MNVKLIYVIARDSGSSFLSETAGIVPKQVKRLWVTAAVAFSCLNLLGQGRVHFGGDNSTPIINSLTGSPVTAADGIKAALYWSPLGSNNFRQLGEPVNVGVPLPGLFIGGTRSTDPATPGGEQAQFQVRAWEAAYGASYEEAIAAPAQCGRGALIGKSIILAMPTGNATPPTPPTLLTAYGLEGFEVQPAPLPAPLPPCIVCPPDFSTNQAVVTYNPAVATGADAPVACMPPSGSTLAIGTNVIASNANGTNHCSFRVTVNDTEPPVINCPPGITVEFRDARGAQVAFAPAAMDAQEGAVIVSCVPASGAVFPIGTSTVVCIATDGSRNSSSCSFNVTVLGARGVIENVLAELITLRQGADPNERGLLNSAPAEFIPRSRPLD